MVRDSPAALARARLARTRTTHSPTPYLTSGERSRKFNLPTTSCHDRHARHDRLHPEPQISHSPRTPPPATMRNVHTFHETHSSAQQQERSKNIRRSQLLRCSRTPGPAANAQRRHRCRHRRLARQFRPAFGQHPGLLWYLAGAADCPVKAPRPPVPLSAALSLSLLPMLRPASCSCGC